MRDLTETAAVLEPETSQAAPGRVGDPVPERAAPADDGLVIDPEFEQLIPPHAADELADLEAEIVAAGRAHDALVVWKGRDILLDGHTRRRLCHKHGLPYTVREEDLPDREAAKR
jgi:ParB-like chromosome segregation protein Spo0J